MKERILMEAYEVEKKCVFENFRLDRVARFDKWTGTINNLSEIGSKIKI